MNYGNIVYNYKEPRFDDYDAVYSSVAGVQYLFPVKKQFNTSLSINYRQKNYVLFTHAVAPSMPAKIRNYIGYLELQFGFGYLAKLSNRLSINSTIQFGRSGFLNRRRNVDFVNGNFYEYKDNNSNETSTSLVEAGLAVELIYFYSEKFCIGIKPNMNKNIHERYNDRLYDIQTNFNYGIKIVIGYVFTKK